MTFLRSVDVEEWSDLPLTVISLFSGCGGFDLGMCKAGFQSRVMVEWDKGCCDTLRANWHWSELSKRTDANGNVVWKNKDEFKKKSDHYHEPEPVILNEDITKLSTKKILDAAGLKVGEATAAIGGPPCQGYSTAGLRIIDDPRNQLFKEFVRVVREAMPKFFIMENVPGITTLANGEIIKQVCDEFASCGYNVSWQILNAADYGVPQHRRRVFIVGTRIDVMRLQANGRPALHIAAFPGAVNHPENFRKKHKMPLKGQNTLDSFKESETVLELLKTINARNMK